MFFSPLFRKTFYRTIRGTVPRPGWRGESEISTQTSFFPSLRVRLHVRPGKILITRTRYSTPKSRFVRRGSRSYGVRAVYARATVREHDDDTPRDYARRFRRQTNRFRRGDRVSWAVDEFLVHYQTRIAREKSATRRRGGGTAKRITIRPSVPAGTVFDRPGPTPALAAAKHSPTDIVVHVSAADTAEPKLNMPPLLFS